MLIDRSFAEVLSPIAHTPTTDVRRRVVADEPAIEVTVAAGDQLFTGVTFDLTPTRLFVVTSRHLDSGAKVSLEIDLPEGEVLAHGTVCAIDREDRDDAPGLRIRFDSLSPSDRGALEAFCSRGESSADSGDSRTSEPPRAARPKRTA